MMVDYLHTILVILRLHMPIIRLGNHICKKAPAAAAPEAPPIVSPNPRGGESDGRSRF